MFHFSKRSVLLVNLLLGLLILSLAACSTDQRFFVAEAAAALNEEVDTALAEPNELVFAGQIEDENGRWLNDCVVVLFRNGEEVTRTSTRLMDSSFTGNGPMDGVFELHTPNVYKLTVAHEIYHPNRALVSTSTVPGVVGTRYLGTWFEDLNPSDMRVLDVPDKQLEYAIVVLPMPLDEVPDNYAPGKLTFQNGMLIVQPEETDDDEGGESAPPEALPLPTPEANIVFNVLPSRNNGQDWHLQMTGYYGNRWDVWERFVSGRIPGLDWETFKYAVLVHNPHLEDDGFVFYSNKTYLLPFAE